MQNTGLNFTFNKLMHIFVQVAMYHI